MGFKFRSLTLDAKKDDKIKGKFKPSKSAESAFYRSLKKVAKTAGHIVESHVTGVHLSNPIEMQKALQDYADLITPWATRQSAKLLDQVQKSNTRAIKNNGVKLVVGLNEQLSDKNFIGALARSLMDEQVALIRSIPIEAGLRAQNIAFEALIHGRRAEPDQDTIDELQKQLGLSTEVATSRAKLIAVTETARANASITQARAVSVGADAYEWVTTMDGAERESHAQMNGKIIRYDSPPRLSDGTVGHAGTFPRCRCWQSPIFSEE